MKPAKRVTPEKMSPRSEVEIALTADRMAYPARGISSPSRSPSARRMADPERTLSFGVLDDAVDGHGAGSSKIDRNRGSPLAGLRPHHLRRFSLSLPPALLWSSSARIRT